MKVACYCVGPLENNTLVVVDEATQLAVVVDPSFDSGVVRQAIRTDGYKLHAVLNTHGHLDHIVENAAFCSEYGVPLAVGALELDLIGSIPEQAEWFGIPAPPEVVPDQLLADGDVFTLGESALKVIHTPGHTVGSICLLGDGFVIVGDVLFAGSIGRTDLSGGDYDQLIQSIRERLLVMPDETVVYPGHGQATTIGRERRTNPFLAG